MLRWPILLRRQREASEYCLWRICKGNVQIAKFVEAAQRISMLKEYTFNIWFYNLSFMSTIAKFVALNWIFFFYSIMMMNRRELVCFLQEPLLSTSSCSLWLWKDVWIDKWFLKVFSDWLELEDKHILWWSNVLQVTTSYTIFHKPKLLPFYICY